MFTLLYVGPYHLNKRGVRCHKTSLAPPLFIEVPVQRKSERSCICVLEVSILRTFTILIFDIGIFCLPSYYLISKYIFVTFIIAIYSNQIIDSLSTSELRFLVSDILLIVRSLSAIT